MLYHINMLQRVYKSHFNDKMTQNKNEESDFMEWFWENKLKNSNFMITNCIYYNLLIIIYFL